MKAWILRHWTPIVTFIVTILILWTVTDYQDNGLTWRLLVPLTGAALWAYAWFKYRVRREQT